MSVFAILYFRFSHLISFSMFGGLVSGALADAVRRCGAESEITELRLRVGRPLVVATATSRSMAKMPSGLPFIVTQTDVDRILAIASDFSVYAVNDQIVKGYVSKRGIRIGVAGEGVSEHGNVLTMKHIGFVTVRIPHQIRTAADSIRGAVFSNNAVRNTLVISPPSGGKTTLLRELARIASATYNTLVIDERFEIAAAERGVPTLDVGECDVLSGVGKDAAYENTIRAMSPEVLVTDELFRKRDVDAVCDAVRSGVKVFASLHGKDTGAVLNSEIFAALAEVMELFVVLEAKPAVGKIVGVFTEKDLRGRGCVETENANVQAECGGKNES